MVKQSRFEVGRIYFSLIYADADLTLPIVYSYLYVGESPDRRGYYKFKMLGADGIDNLSDADVESFVGVIDLADLLAQWALKNPKLRA